MAASAIAVWWLRIGGVGDEDEIAAGGPFGVGLCPQRGRRGVILMWCGSSRCNGMIGRGNLAWPQGDC